MNASDARIQLYSPRLDPFNRHHRMHLPSLKVRVTFISSYDPSYGDYVGGTGTQQMPAQLETAYEDANVVANVSTVTNHGVTIVTSAPHQQGKRQLTWPVL
jgi:hypothetical protein